MLFCIFGLSAFIASTIVDKCGARVSMCLGALCYTLYIGTYLIAEIAYQPETHTTTINKSYITAMILVGAAINGFGGAILFVG